MTKNTAIMRAFLFALSALCIFAVSTVFGISIFEEWLGIIAGGLVMVAAIPLHVFGKKCRFLYIMSFLFNTAACGFSASAYYNISETNAELGEFLTAVFIAIVFLLFCTAVYCFTVTAFKTVCITLIIFNAVLAAFAVHGWISEGDAFFSFLFFSCIVTTFYIVAIKSAAIEYESGNIARTVSLHSFGIFILITIIVIAIISEGDSLDVLDSDMLSSEKKNTNVNEISDAVLASEFIDTSIKITDTPKSKDDNNESP